MAKTRRTRPFWFSVCLIPILSPLLLACKSSLQAIQPIASTCASDGDTTPKERETVGQLAVTFVQNALGPDPSRAYASLTDDAKGTIPADQFVSGFQNVIRPMGPFKDLRVAHTYIATVTGGSQEQRTVCGNLSSPENWVAVNVKPGPSNAHVIVEGETVNNTMAFVLWLIPEQGAWHIQHVQYTVDQMVGKSALDLRKTAETENEKGHSFNAFILYTAALQLAERGPFFQLGIRPDIEKEIGELKRPGSLQGQLPYTWAFGKSTFKVLNVGPIGLSGRVYLVIDHEIEPWAEDKEADRRNRDLIKGFSVAYPEYKDVFAGLVVRAHERGGRRGYGTVDENQK